MVKPSVTEECTHRRSPGKGQGGACFLLYYGLFRCCSISLILAVLFLVME